MKPLLLLLSLVAAAGASAQNKQADSLQRLLRERLASKYQQMPNAWQRTTPHSYQFNLKRKDSQPGLLPPSAPGVYHLPIDGMPCVVPDTSGIAAIPNAFANPQVPFSPANGIPNPMDRAAQGK